MRWAGLKSYNRVDGVRAVFILTISDYTRKFIEMILLDLLHLNDKVLVRCTKLREVLSGL